VGTTGAAQADRWHSSLPLDLKRAAPEIYRSMRSQGAASAREWVDRQYRGDRSSHTWIDIWDLATEVDFRLRDFIEAKDDQGLFRTLAVDDGLEIKLRRLASFLNGPEWVTERAPCTCSQLLRRGARSTSRPPGW
jgi:hypothetical protein